MRRSGGLVATTTTLAALALAAPAAAAPIAAERSAERLGFQVVPKHRAGKSANAFSNARGANPFIALLPNPSTADHAYWKSAMKRQSAKRAAKRNAAPRALAVEPLLVDERSRTSCGA